jgi:ribose transport system permease protein
MSATATDNIDLDLRAVPKKPLLQRLFSITATWVLSLDIVLVIVFGIISGGIFFTPRAIESMLLTSTQGLLLALGVAMLLGAGVFDLSVGANLVLSSVVGAMVIKAVAGAPTPEGDYQNLGLAITLGVLASIGTGIAFGLVNGFLIAYLEINSLIATLGTMGIGQGLALLIGGGGDITAVPRQLQENFGQAEVLGIIPLPTIIAIVAAILLFLVLRFTRFGVNTLAIGSWRPAAEGAGIKVKQHILVLTALTGGLAGIAGFIDISRYGSTAITGHATDALAAVTAVVIGGTLLEGGRVSIVGTVWGVLLAVILLTGLIVVGVAAFYQLIAIGVVLIVAVAIDRYRARRRTR